MRGRCCILLGRQREGARSYTPRLLPQWLPDAIGWPTSCYPQLGVLLTACSVEHPINQLPGCSVPGGQNLCGLALLTLNVRAAEKLQAAEHQLANRTKPARFMTQPDKKASSEQGQLKKVARDASNLALEQAKGLATQVGPGSGHAAWGRRCAEVRSRAGALITMDLGEAGGSLCSAKAGWCRGHPSLHALLVSPLLQHRAELRVWSPAHRAVRCTAS